MNDESNLHLNDSSFLNRPLYLFNEVVYTYDRSHLFRTETSETAMIIRLIIEWASDLSFYTHLSVGIHILPEGTPEFQLGSYHIC